MHLSACMSALYLKELLSFDATDYEWQKSDPAPAMYVPSD